MSSHNDSHDLEGALPLGRIQFSPNTEPDLPDPNSLSTVRVVEKKSIKEQEEVPSMIENATISSVYLGGWEDAVPTNKLCVSLMFSGDGWGQGSGYYSGNIEEFVRLVLVTVDVSEWSKLKGAYCRIGREGGRITAVGHWSKDNWFEFSSLYGKESA